MRMDRTEYGGTSVRRVQSDKPSIECTRVLPTIFRPGSEGTYIVRLSPTNMRRLKVKSGAYVEVSYGNALVLACLSVDQELDNETIRMDQTLRAATCLDMIMGGSGKKELVYRPGGDRDLEHPIVVRRAIFRGPSLLDKLVKQQYIICTIHHAMPDDMERSVARLTTDSMKVIGIQPGDKVLLVSHKRRKAVRCLAMNPDFPLPSDSMLKYFPAPCHVSQYEEMRLPWVTMDLETRVILGVEPWQPIFVGRYVPQLLAPELTELTVAVVLAGLGSALVLKDIHFLLPIAAIITGVVVATVVILLKIRSRL